MWVWVLCVGGGKEERRWKGGGEGGEEATDSIEPQNSHKQSLLSGLDQEHHLLGTPMPDFGRGIFTDVTGSTVTSGISDVSQLTIIWRIPLPTSPTAHEETTQCVIISRLRKLSNSG